MMLTRARRNLRILLGTASVTLFAVAVLLLVELRSSVPPSFASFPTEAAWLSYFWWYNGLPAQTIFVALLGVYLGVATILVGTMTARSAKRFGLISCLLLVNLFYAVIPGGLFYRLSFYPPLEGALLTGFASFVTWLPGQTSGLDVLGLGLLLTASSLAYSIWNRRGRARAFLRALEVFALGLLPLPFWVYLLDRNAFGVHVADVQAGTALVAISNADLLLGLCLVIPALMLVDVRQKRVRT